MQKLTLASYEVDEDYVAVNYSCNFTVTTAGDGLWGCEAGRKVHVTNICVLHNAYEDNITTQVNVTHNSTWDIYTDTAFAAAISDALGFAVSFTEQGMQDDNYASMEA
jgi:hypothetical protein